MLTFVQVHEWYCEWKNFKKTESEHSNFFKLKLFHFVLNLKNGVELNFK